MPTYTHVIFDLDGTLVDSAPAILATFSSVLATNGIRPVVEVGEHLIGPPLDATLRALTGIDDPRVIERLADDFKSRYDSAGVYATVVYPGVNELLQRLRRAELTLAIATNKRLHPTRLLIDHFGWGECFQVVYCLDARVPFFGSKTDMLEALMLERSLSPQRSAFVGDTAPDAEAARKNGVHFYAVAWGYGERETLAGAHAIAENPDQLGRFLMAESAV